MATASRRRLPPFPPETVISPWWLPGVPAAVAALCLAGQLVVPAAFFGVLAVVFGWAVIAGMLDRRLKDLALRRPGDSICTFARTFDRRRVDTLVVRAVYQEFQHLFRFEAPDFPLRAADDLCRDLRIDPEHLAFNHVPSIARRTARSMADCDKNPYFGRVQTVGDLVHFFCAQPRSDQSA